MQGEEGELSEWKYDLYMAGYVGRELIPSED